MEVFLVVILGIVIWGFVKAKTRMYHGNKLTAERLASGDGPVRYASWSNDQAQIEHFSAMTKALCERKGIPPMFAAAMLANKTVGRTVLRITGAMEQQGASFNEQVLAASAQIEEYWGRATPEQKEMVLRESA